MEISIPIWTPAPRGLKDNPGVFDTGSGAIQTIEVRARYPGVERVTVESYCGRADDNDRYYRLASDPKRTFTTVRGAAEAAARG